MSKTDKLKISCFFILLAGILSPLYVFAQTEQVYLHEGWTLVGLPVTPQTSYTAESLGQQINSQGGTCNRIMRWDGSGWQTHLIGMPFGDFSINTQEGYFVLCTAPSTWTVTGDPITTLSEYLHEGWSLINTPFETLTAESMGNSINLQGGTCNRIMRWDGSGWQTHLIGMPFGDFPIKKDAGYFVLCNAPSTWNASLYVETEPNGTFATATSIPFGYPISGAINSIGDQDYYKFTVTKPGTLNISLTNVPANIDASIYLYNASQQQIAYKYSGGNGNSISLQATLSATGDYYLLVIDNGNNASSPSPYYLNIKIDTLVFGNISVTPSIFSPNGDNQKDTTNISANIDTSSDWKITINNASGVLKRTFVGTGTDINQVWEGKDQSGVVVADGVYTCILSATDPAGDTGTASTQITVDTIGPNIIITSPIDGAVVNTPTLTVNYTSDGVAKNKQVTLTTGSNTITISETDDAGNTGTASIKVTLLMPQPSEIIYIYLNGQRIASKDNTGTYFYLNDHLGGTNVITDASGQEVKRVDYWPYGSTREQSGTKPEKHLFTGKEFDSEVGLYFYGSRYYDPNICRFISADSSSKDPSNPQKLNRYSYCLNNPLIYVDPSGNDELPTDSSISMTTYLYKAYSGNLTYSDVGLFVTDVILTAKAPIASKALGLAGGVVDLAQLGYYGISTLNAMWKEADAMAGWAEMAGKVAESKIKQATLLANLRAAK